MHHRVKIAGNLFRQQTGADQRDSHPPSGGVNDVALHVHKQPVATLPFTGVNLKLHITSSCCRQQTIR
ncbi:Uncharacterised protein [Salmonella enterica subsp. enterica serovar Bovismorbificans]|uniref:Uncharacterized protein n=1 Tax=Salmonella enterica subsp. enterica serovar Bovismorbificans TaxID=58097 RepID=A0A655C8G4_SALET|nr:Uncharacterised protein [Salmonella enterica subsp. enterica serovar Bovismorbificans]